MVFYPGGIISSNPVKPSTSSASGLWSITEQLQASYNGIWPATSAAIGSVNAIVAMIGGGAGATGGVSGVNFGAGGAGGVLRYANSVIISGGGSNYTVVVGAGGAGIATGTPSSGSNSTFGTSSVIATGGNGASSSSTIGGSNADYVGGTGSGSYGAGGGAGAAGNGGASNAGGPGANIAISGTFVSYGGGGAGKSTSAATGGIGGGGNSDTSAAYNTGGGAGGTGAGLFTNGGSGIVIINYPAPQYFTGGVVTNATNINGTNVVHTFTTSANLVALATPIDTYQPYNSLLLHADGTNSANNSVFLDSSTLNNTITKTGSTTQGTFSPFSTTGWSNYFNGTTDFVQATSVPAIGTSDFTFECWVNPTTYVYSMIGGNWSPLGGNTGAFQLTINATGFLQWQIYTNNNVTGTINVPLNKWTHVAISRINGTVYQFVNGVLDNIGASSINITNTGLNLAGATGGNFFNGYISNARLIIGTSLYNTAFTPSNAPLINISNTALLTATSNQFVGSNTTSNNVTITVTGTPKVQPFSPFNPTSVYSNTSVSGSILTGITSSDGLTIPYSTSTSRFTGDFTVECWFYMNNTTGTQTIFTQRTTSYVPFLVWVASGTLTLYMSSTNASWDIINGQTLGTIVPNQWYHYALVRSGSSIKSYLNGAVVGAGATSSATLDSSTLGFRVGCTSGTEYFNGYISNVRMVNGTAVYTSAFTPPTAPLTAITNTTFLLNATNASIIDSSQKNELITYGSAAISTTQSKFGGTSMYFDGSTGYLSNPSSTAFTFGPGDFTVEYWVYYNAISGSSYQQICGGSSTSAGFSFGLSSTPKLYMTTFSVSYTSTGTTLVTGQWYHVAFVRKSGTVYFYLNGVLDYSVSAATTITETGFGIGGGKTGVNFSSCYVDELRVTQGYARYTSNFTPQTSAFLNT
jgi:hypothetical protein